MKTSAEKGGGDLRHTQRGKPCDNGGRDWHLSGKEPKDIQSHRRSERGMVPEGTNPANTLILNFWPSEQWESKFPLFKATNFVELCYGYLLVVGGLNELRCIKGLEQRQTSGECCISASHQHSVISSFYSFLLSITFGPALWFYLNFALKGFSGLHVSVPPKIHMLKS